LSEEIFLLPDVGEGLVEAEIVEWKVNVGDVVTLNQPLVDIETAKATVELPSPYAGTVVALHGKPGDVMEVHKPLITFEVGGSGASAAPAPVAPSEPTPAPEPSEKQEGSVGEGREAVLIGYGVANEDGVATRKHRRQSGSKPAAPAPAAAATAAPTAAAATAPAPAPAATVVSTTSSLAPRSTPPVRLYAKQHGLDIASLTGTGRDGLITREDVEQALNGGGAPSPSRVSTPITGPNTTSRFVGRELESWSTGPKEERIPVKGVLRSMAEAMVHSAFTQPRAAVWVRVDATRTMDLVTSLKQQPNLAGVRLSPLTIIALAVCDAARHFPGINSSFDADANEVIVRRTVNLGIAADTHRGLIVPNIKGADQLDLIGMASALTVLVDKARQGTTTPNEMIGTTLSITNVGPFGVDAAIPILPPGTGAILAVGQIAKAPWVVDDEVVVRQVVELAMAFDHRQVDGAMASAVLSHIGRFLHDPAPAIIAS
jgi:pyruvate dehydrogenase E2 component (dihydrolipoamide acetyltransferase)